MYQHLDDPVPLPPSTAEQRRDTLHRGRILRRRRRALAIAVPFAAAVVVIALIGSLVLWRVPGEVPTYPPVASAPPSASLYPSDQITLPPGLKFSSCGHEPLGDSIGEPDLRHVGLDHPSGPFIHITWKGWLPRTGSAAVIFWATSADGQRSRLFVTEIVDRSVADKFVVDPATGIRQSVSSLGTGYSESTTDLTADGLGTGFPRGTTSELGTKWTWKLFIMADGAITDACASP